MTTATSQPDPVIIVGAGLAGLCCARALHASGIPVRVLEAADRPGGRVATDRVDGFLLDRGFQVLLTAYPEAQRILDYTDLCLGQFYPGALIQIDHRRYRFADPWRKPLAALGAITAPVAGPIDALRIGRMRRRIRDDNPTGMVADERSTRVYLEQQGFGARVIDRFFTPFFGGVFLERDLHTPSGLFRFVFNMFSRGYAALPARGMGAIPAQLAAELPDGTIEYGCKVTQVTPNTVTSAAGTTRTARRVVVATVADAAADLVPGLPVPTWNGTTTVYYAADSAPLDEGILVLNGSGTGIVNHVSVPSAIHPSYAPEGHALISVSLMGTPDGADDALDRRVRGDLAAWFGTAVDGWSHLRTYRIRRALPRVTAPGSPTVRDGVYFCGDFLEDPSINGAMVSGRRVAERVLETLGVTS